MALSHSLISPDVYPHRRAAALAAAKDRGLDGLVIWGRGGETGAGLSDLLFYTNHFSAYPGAPQEPGYLTSIQHGGAVIDPSGRTILLVSGFASEDAQADEIRRGINLYALLEEVLREVGLGEACVGLIGSEAFPFSLGQSLRSGLPKLALTPVDDISTEQRMQLSPDDVLMLRNAADVGTRIVTAITDRAAPGVTEGHAVGAGLAEAARTPGCMHWNFMIASGPDHHHFVRASTPGWNPEYVYRRGDVLHIDAYGFVFGYMYDLMRTAVVGVEPTDDQRRTIVAARDLTSAMAGMLQPGVTARDLREGALRQATAAGFDPSGNATFGHRINFGWARPYLEEPFDRADVDVAIESPSAFAFETFLHDDRGNYAKWEDMFAWLPRGTERLTGADPGPDLTAPLL